MKKLAIEGINGAGKTPTLAHVQALCETDGLVADQYAAFHLVRDKIDEPDIFNLWADRPQLAVRKLHETFDEIEADARARQLDVLLFDRHWLTVFTQAETNPAINDYWGDRFVPTVLLTSPTNHLRRLSERGYKAQWLQQDELEYYRQLYDTLYDRHTENFLGRFVVSSSTQDLRPVAQELYSLITDMKED